MIGTRGNIDGIGDALDGHWCRGKCWCGIIAQLPAISFAPTFDRAIGQDGAIMIGPGYQSGRVSDAADQRRGKGACVCPT